MSAVQNFIDLLRTTVSAPRLSGSKVQQLTTLALALPSPSDATHVVAEWFKLNKALPHASQARISSLYVFDAVARGAAKAGNKTGGDLVMKMEGVVDGWVGGMVDDGKGGVWNEGKEKTRKIIDIWRKASTFSADTIARLQARLTQAVPRSTTPPHEPVRPVMSPALPPLEMPSNSVPAMKQEIPSGSWGNNGEGPSTSRSPPSAPGQLPPDILKLLGIANPPPASNGNASNNNTASSGLDIASILSAVRPPPPPPPAQSTSALGNIPPPNPAAAALASLNLDPAKLAQLAQLAQAGQSQPQPYQHQQIPPPRPAPYSERPYPPPPQQYPSRSPPRPRYDDRRPPVPYGGNDRGPPMRDGPPPRDYGHGRGGSWDRGPPPPRERSRSPEWRGRGVPDRGRGRGEWRNNDDRHDRPPQTRDGGFDRPPRPPASPEHGRKPSRWGPPKPALPSPPPPAGRAPLPARPGTDEFGRDLPVAVGDGAEAGGGEEDMTIDNDDDDDEPPPPATRPVQTTTLPPPQPQLQPQLQPRAQTYAPPQAAGLTLETIDMAAFNPADPACWAALAQAWKASMGGREPAQVELMQFVMGRMAGGGGQ